MSRGRVQGLGTILESHLAKKMEDQMESGVK